MVYVPFTLNLSPSNIGAMCHGGSIKVSNKQHTGHKVFITKGQYNRLMKSKSSGRSISLKMTPAQYKYNMKHGSGLFSDIFSKIKDAGAYAYNNIAKPILTPVVNSAVNSLVNAGQKRVAKIADPYINQASNYIGGSGVAPPQLYNNDIYNTGAYRQGRGRKKKGAGNAQLYNNDVYNTGAYRQDGEGFFDSVGDFFKGAVNTIAPLAVPIATSIITKRLGGKVKKTKKKKSSAGGLFPLGAKP